MAEPEIPDPSEQDPDSITISDSGVQGELESFTSGQTVLHYRVLASVGEGGMGQVYRAQDLKLERDVAIKVLPPSAMKNAAARRRLLHEARAASALNHPNIVTIFAIEELDQCSFIVMEYIEGASLLQTIENGTLALMELLDIGIQICEALDATHPLGIIHRDIKPGNVMITSKGKVKLLDFGLAKRIQSTAAGFRPNDVHSVRTSPGFIAGTVTYMSPEQTRGEELDGRSDIFSLGSLLYHCATGHPPFEGLSVLSILHEISTKRPISPSTVRPDLPDEFDGIIEKALVKTKENRYQTAAELGDALNHLKSRIRGLAPSSATVGPPVIRNVPQSIAVLPFLNAGSSAEVDYLCLGITEHLLNKLSALPNLRLIPRSTVLRYRGKEIDPQQVGRDLRVSFVLMGRLICHNSSLNIQTELIDVENNSQIWGEQLTRKISDIFMILDEIAKEIVEKLRLKLTGEEQQHLLKHDTENTDAYHSYLKGRYHLSKRTAENFRKAAEYFQQAIRKDPRYALAYTGLADSHNLLASYAYLAPKETLILAKNAGIKALEIDNASGEAHASLGYSLMLSWDWENAENEFRRAIELNPNYSTAHQWFGLLLNVLCRFDEAFLKLNKALQLDPLSVVINVNLGMLYFFRRDYDQAIQQFHAALELQPDHRLTLFFLGLTYEANGQISSAIEQLRASISDTVRYEAALAHALALDGNLDLAEKMLGRLRQLSSSQYVSPADIAIVQLALGETDPAFESLRRACEDSSSWMIFLRVDPRFDPIRSDVRFQSLLRITGLQGIHGN